MRILLQTIAGVLLLTSVLTVSIKKEHSKFILSGANLPKSVFPSLVGVDNSPEKTAVAVLAERKKNTGIVVNIGEGEISVVPVVQKTVLSDAIITAPYGGKDVTDYLRNLLEQAGYSFTTPKEIEIVKRIKETLCFVAENFDEMTSEAESTSAFERNFELPDGQVITVGKQRFTAPEMLLKPSLVGIENEGIHNLIYQSIMKASPEVRKDLYDSIVLTGGSNVFHGMAERISREVTAIAPPTVKVRVATQ